MVDRANVCLLTLPVCLCLPAHLFAPRPLIAVRTCITW